MKHITLLYRVFFIKLSRLLKSFSSYFMFRFVRRYIRDLAKIGKQGHKKNILSTFVKDISCINLAKTIDPTAAGRGKQKK